jgi:hypothetical protein
MEIETTTNAEHAADTDRDLVFRTEGVERLRIGDPYPAARALHVVHLDAETKAPATQKD